MMTTKLRVAGAMVVIAVASVASGRSEAQCASGAEYAQTEPVKRRYPDPQVRLDTPAFTPGKTGFTSHEEMMVFLERLSGQSTNLQVRIAGYSQEGREIPALLFTNSGR